MDLLSEEQLIERIYDAAIVPDLWKPVLDQITDRVDAAGTGLVLISERSSTALWSDGLLELGTGWIEGNWQAKTQRAPRMMALNHAGFVTDIDIYGPGELEKDEAFANYLKPAGYGYGAGTGIIMPTGEAAVFSIERRYETGPFTREDCESLDPLRPHLARAALLSGRASVERARTMTNTLHALGIPGAVVRLNGRLLTANPMFEQLIPSLFTDGQDRLHLTSVNADRLLGEALGFLSRSTVYRGVSSIPIPSDGNTKPMIVHLVPARGVAQDFFLNASVIVLITPVESSSAPAINVLQGLFDLTPTEAKVAQGICGALSIDAVAASLGVKRETVRTHMKAVMAKTGVKRQGELISILAGKHLPFK